MVKYINLYRTHRHNKMPIPVSAYIYFSNIGYTIKILSTELLQI